MLEFLDDPPLDISILLSSGLDAQFEYFLYVFASIPNVRSELDPIPAVLEQQLEPEEVDPTSKEYNLDFSFWKENTGKDDGPELDPFDIEDPNGPSARENPFELPADALVP